MDTRPDEAIDRVLRTGDPANVQHLEPHLQEVLRWAVSMERQGETKQRKRWLLAPAAVIAALVGGLAISGALPAFAETVQHFVAQTGVFGDGEGPGGSASGKHYTEMDDSEWIDLTSPDFRAYAVRLMPASVTLPAAVSRARFANDVAALLALPDDGRGAVMQVTGIRAAFEANASCVWYQTWHDAALRGDQELAAEAAAQYDASASWHETVATDGGGVVASMHRVHALSARGDWAAARAILGVDCTRADYEAVTR